MPFSNKVILVTGGTGSFGKKFTQIILKEHNPKAIRIFSRGELKQQKMQEQFQQFPNSEKLRFFIGDVRDKDRLYRAMNGVDIVIHAAALKQVPTCEYNPIEAVKTNIDGAANVIDAAIDNNVEKVMALSTDKAVHPVNLYGATKLVAEKLFIQGNTYSGGRKTKFSCVRYGNVMASRGSVIPIFQEQRKNGTITITDRNMTRFWITQEQAVHFIIDCIERMKGGEIFVPKIPSMKIIDLAQAIAPQSEIKITGIRPGEKINEVLLTGEEARHAKEFDKYFVVEPEYAFWDKNNFKDGKSLSSDFTYSSGDNDQWLTKQELMKMLEDL
ncbi:UDP-N-acetylglucosamine 4,6-dehydratase (inverting) [bacterium]|nr:UDP-N-acetylglucosamine 4,6-dehydratase (inverting) [bacterium]